METSHPCTLGLRQTESPSSAATPSTVPALGEVGLGFNRVGVDLGEPRIGVGLRVLWEFPIGNVATVPPENHPLGSLRPLQHVCSHPLSDGEEKESRDGPAPRGPKNPDTDMGNSSPGNAPSAEALATPGFSLRVQLAQNAPAKIGSSYRLGCGMPGTQS